MDAASRRGQTSVRSALRAVVGAALAVCALLASTVAAPVASSQQMASETFTVVVVPDTQKYIEFEDRVPTVTAMMDWIATGGAGGDVAFVTHVGDLVQNPDVPDEWVRAEEALAPLVASGLPWGLAGGNHDLLPLIDPAPYETWFPEARFEDKAWFGEGFPTGTTRFSYQTVSVGDRALLFLHLRHFTPAITDDVSDEEAYEWVRGVLATHPNHTTFVTTHEFTDADGSIRKPELQTVLAESCQVSMVFSGHRFGSAAGTFTDDCGREVHHVLTNFQGELEGGGGFLRTLDIDNDTLQADLRVYSPVSDTERPDPPNTMTLTLAEPAIVTVAGDVDCDFDVDLLDAYATARLAISSYSDSGTCELAQPGVSVPAVLADVDGSGDASLLDARLIAQCAIGLPNIACLPPASS